MTDFTTHSVAKFVIKYIDKALDFVGLPTDSVLQESCYTILIFLLAFFIGWVARIIMMYAIHHWKLFRKFDQEDSDLRQQTAQLPAGPAYSLRDHLNMVSQNAGHLLTPIVFLSLISFAFPKNSVTLKWLLIIAGIYLTIRVVLLVNSLLGIVWHAYDLKRNSKNHPLKGLLQVSKGLVWAIGLIVCGSLLFQESPGALFAGLGAFSAVTMLIFKDSILGFVAGIQLTFNDSLREGDWVVVPGSNANGIVLDVSLTAVKIRNWDNTFVFLPPYSFVSSPFQNYRGMSLSGVRRINVTFMIDVDSIQPTTPEMLEEFKSIPYMKDYIETKQAQIAKDGFSPNTNNPAGLVNGTIDTNLGALRAYFTMYLRNNPMISQRPEDTLMIMPGEPTADGLPFNIYCFSRLNDWVSYESIMSEVMEHFAAITPRFGLYVFANPSGRDTVNQGFLEGGLKPNQVMGLPYQSIYNWHPGDNPDPKAYPYWDRPVPQNNSVDFPLSQQADA